MPLSNERRNIIESLLDNESIKEMKELSNLISERYVSLQNKNQLIIDENKLAKVYAVIRLASTYSAYEASLIESLKYFKDEINTVNDLGAGLASASIAISDHLQINKINLLEKSEAMINVGNELINLLSLNDKLHYVNFDVIKDELEKADLVTSSYLLNELDKLNRLEVIKKMWAATNKMMLIVEPGTPNGFEVIKEVRDYVISKGGYILAPCPHMDTCPYDWCHFSSRVNRSKLEKYLKGGESPYEDEKYCYIAFSKIDYGRSNGRILRHPLINNGYVEVEVCDKSGINKIKITKKDKEKYKKIRKSGGDDEY